MEDSHTKANPVSHRLNSRHIAALVFAFLGLDASSVLSQTVEFSPAPWKDCATAKCDAGEAFRYLAWSRQSDNNVCKATLDARGFPKGACDALVPSNAIGPIDDIGVVKGFMQFFNSQTNTFPLPWGSSTVGFALDSENELRLPILRSKSFGPLFSETPFTGGRGSWSAVLTVQHLNWQRIDGQSLDAIAFEQSRDTTRRDLCLEDDCTSLRWTAELEYRTRAVVLGTSFGVTDRFDLGLTVPLVTAQISGRAFRSGGFSPQNPNGQIQAQISASGATTGLGDISLRGKVAFTKQQQPDAGSWQFGTSGELRLPSGDADALTGTGSKSARFQFLGSFSSDPLSDSILRRTNLHFNVGYLVAGAGFSRGPAFHIYEKLPLGTTDVGGDQYTADFHTEVSDEILFSAGFDSAVTDGITVAADLLTRTLVKGAVYRPITFVDSQNKRNVQPFLDERSFMPITTAAFGAKARVARRWLATAYVLVSLGTSGLRPSWSPVLGLERIR